MWISRQTWIVCSGLVLTMLFFERITFGQSAAPGTQKADAKIVRQELDYLGAGSCSAAACHGANGLRPKFALEHRSTESLSAHSTWIQRDAHAEAYQVLLKKESIDILNLLRKPWKLSDKKQPHEEARCLSCHSTLDPQSAEFAANAGSGEDVPDEYRLNHSRLADGVSCEACHGPAKQWQVPHTRHSWRHLSQDERTALNFRDLRNDLVSRAQNCAECHVGGPGRDVNHDMIAAGHPRLNFEFSAFHANMPAHWSHDLDRKSFHPADISQPGATPSIRETKLWLVGQLATSEAALKLLENRITASRSGHGAWPEFSEYSCYACHHDLQSPSWRQAISLEPWKPEPGVRPLQTRKPGSYPWGTWTFSILEKMDLQGASGPWADELKNLEVAMSNPAPDRDIVLKLALAAQGTLKRELAKHVTPASLKMAEAQTLLEHVLQNGPELSGRDWDGAAQTYLATLSLYHGKKETEGRLFDLKSPVWKTDPVLQSLVKIREQLTFPVPQSPQERINSPRAFNTGSIQTIRAELKSIAEQVKAP